MTATATGRIGGGAVTRQAAASFALGWAQVPRSPAARRARSILVFGVGPDVNGFNISLACCNSLQSAWMGALEAGRGAFVENAKGVWVEDIVTQASADAKGVSYTIRPDAFWYWGGRKLPVTYRDFVYTLQRIDDPNSLVAVRGGYANLDPSRYTHKGLKQVRFFWKTTDCSADFPCGPFANWRSLFSPLYPAAALTGEDFNTIWTDCICGNDGKPVSDGPFYLSNYTRGQGTILHSNPFWYGRKAGLAEIVMKTFADPDFEVQAMRGGEIDASVPPFGADLVPLTTTPGVTFKEIPGYYFEHLEFRETKGSSNPLLRAPWMRQAIALGIDRQGIVKTVLGELAGNTKPLDNMIYYSTQASYVADFARWSYNPVTALAILKRHCTGGPTAPSASNSAIWECFGLPARFRWSFSAGVSTRADTEAIAQAELKAIGIDVSADPLASNVLYGPAGLPGGNFDIADFGDITTGDPSDWSDSWRCGGTSNFTGYCSARASALLRAGDSELDPGKRAADFQAADRLMAAAVPVLPLFQRPDALAYRSNILGMVANPSSFGPIWNIEAWHWR